MCYTDQHPDNRQSVSTHSSSVYPSEVPYIAGVGFHATVGNDRQSLLISTPAEDRHNMRDFLKTVTQACSSPSFYASLVKESKSKKERKRTPRMHLLLYLAGLIAVCALLQMSVGAFRVNPLAWSAVDFESAVDSIEETFPQDLVITIEGEKPLDEEGGQTYSRITTNQEPPYSIHSRDAIRFISQMSYSSPIIEEFIRNRYPGFRPAEFTSWDDKELPALVTFERVPVGLTQSLNISNDHPSVFSDGPEFEGLSQFCYIYHSVVVVIEYGYVLCPQVINPDSRDSSLAPQDKTEEVIEDDVNVEDVESREIPVPLFSAENKTHADDTFTVKSQQRITVHDKVGPLMFFPFHDLDAQTIDRDAVRQWSTSMRESTLFIIAARARIPVALVCLFIATWATSMLSWSLVIACFIVVTWVGAVALKKMHKLPSLTFDGVFEFSIFSVTPAVVASPFVGETFGIILSLVWGIYVMRSCAVRSILLCVYKTQDHLVVESHRWISDEGWSLVCSSSFGTSNYRLLNAAVINDSSVSLDVPYILYARPEEDIVEDDEYQYALAYIDIDGMMQGQGHHVHELISFQLKKDVMTVYKEVKLIDGPHVLFCDHEASIITVCSYLGGTIVPIYDRDWDEEYVHSCEELLVIYNLPLPVGYQKMIGVMNEKNGLQVLSVVQQREVKNQDRVAHVKKFKCTSTPLLSHQQIIRKIDRDVLPGSTVRFNVSDDKAHHETWREMPDIHSSHLQRMLIYNSPNTDLTRTERCVIVATNDGNIQEFSSGQKMRTKPMGVVPAEIIVNGVSEVTLMDYSSWQAVKKWREKMVIVGDFLRRGEDQLLLIPSEEESPSQSLKRSIVDDGSTSSLSSSVRRDEVEAVELHNRHMNSMYSIAESMEARVLAAVQEISSITKRVGARIFGPPDSLVQIKEKEELLSTVVSKIQRKVEGKEDDPFGFKSLKPLVQKKSRKKSQEEKTSKKQPQVTIYNAHHSVKSRQCQLSYHIHFDEGESMENLRVVAFCPQLASRCVSRCDVDRVAPGQSFKISAVVDVLSEAFTPSGAVAISVVLQYRTVSEKKESHQYLGSVICTPEELCGLARCSDSKSLHIISTDVLFLTRDNWTMHPEVFVKNSLQLHTTHTREGTVELESRDGMDSGMRVILRTIGREAECNISTTDHSTLNYVMHSLHNALPEGVVSENNSAGESSMRSLLRLSRQFEEESVYIKECMDKILQLMKEDEDEQVQEYWKKSRGEIMRRQVCTDEAMVIFLNRTSHSQIPFCLAVMTVVVFYIQQHKTTRSAQMTTLRHLLALSSLIVLALPFTLGEYTPDWDSLDARPIPSWYDEVKIGIFVHWGVFSVPAHSCNDGAAEWYWYNWKNDLSGCNAKWHNDTYGADFKYAEFGPMFKAELFDPVYWAKLFKKSGAKHVVLTSKHHEGWTNFPSAEAWNWNSVDNGPGKDLTKMLADAVRNEGLKMGLYHSLFEWFHPLYLQDKANNFATSRYVDEVLMPQLKYISNNYSPSVIWADGDWEAKDSYWKSKDYLAWLYNSSPSRDEVVVNDRWGSGDRNTHGGFWTGGDRYNPNGIQQHKWENCFTLDRGSWGFNRDATLKDYLSMDEILALVVGGVAKNGNVLINVGPTADGVIAPIYEERLTQLGKWLDVNGESIYGSRPWKYANDTGSTQVWYTLKNTTIVYASFTPWPQDNFLSLSHPRASADTTVSLLGFRDGEAQLQYVQKEGQLVIKLPANIRPGDLKSEHMWTIRMEGLDN
ncbi:alpha-L-fucosidase-like [Planoprotostelium fungivorum]|uniref:alpha-L-fucosidase n=1 Tax=Planoprotostelium fungivorum TaxID=1890364 RepID=A0A2P6MQZ6_9EUKA|nr:alpha-L-fucosidase-like [Planoprotostelium fungivorum]